MPSALVLNFFPAFSPASSGGELRVGKLYRALSNDYDITMISSSDFGGRFEQIRHTPTFKELRFPKDEFWRDAYETLNNSGITGELSGLAFALAVSDPACPLRQRARELAACTNVVIHEFPFSEPIFADGSAPREIYNSHNFETSLLSSIVHGPGFEQAFLKLMRIEGNLVARAERVFATSYADMEKFSLFFGAERERLGYCPNGYDEADLEPIAAARQSGSVSGDGRPQLLFTGSAHQPNVEAAEYLLSLAQEVPECDIVIAGGVSKALSAAPALKNVRLIGPFDEATKTNLLSEATLFLNPVVLGSGTSLKAIEALGAGIPMVSTPEGVRGLDVKHGIHADIVGREAFASSIRRLVASSDACRSLAAAGMIYAAENLTWTSIGRRLADDLRGTSEPLAEARRPRPMVLAFNDYPVPTAASGGMARIRRMHDQLGTDVILLSFGSAAQIDLMAPGILHVTIPKSSEHLAFQHAINEGQQVSANDVVASLFVASNRAMVDVACALARRAQALIFEHCYMAPLLDVLTPLCPSVPVIYSAHNIEALHKAESLRRHPVGEALSNSAAEIEIALTGKADLLVVCTERDAQYFATYGAETVVVPNGCIVPGWDTLLGAVDKQHINGSGQPRAKVGFLGSAHGPNVSAARFILTEMAPAFPDVDFELVGTVCEAVGKRVGPNVCLRGVLDEVTKTETLAQWTLALNPVASGGGSSLKLSDYMAHALPSINTSTGARGFPVETEGAGVVVKLDEFSRSLSEMLGDPGGRQRMAENAYRFAYASLDWASITRDYRERLHQLLAPPPQAAGRLPSLLVVTYRYTEPPLGGAEEYLVEVLKRLRPRFGVIDLAAVDIGHITNEHHFGCRIDAGRPGAARRIAELFDKAMYFAPDMLAPEEMLQTCRRLERAWTREEFTLFGAFAAELAGPEPHLHRPRVLAGFFWPENHGGTIRRWTSPRFSFLLPAACLVFRMAGYSAGPKILKLTLMVLAPDGATRIEAESAHRIEGGFTLNVALPRLDLGDGHAVMFCRVDEHQVKDDHRPFGLLLDSVSVLRGSGPVEDAAMAPLAEHFVDLTQEIEQGLRTDHFERWIAALKALAEARADSVEADFAAVRGPHSADMQAWLARHGAGYDTVLVQGIPFDVIPSTVETLAALAQPPRIVTLPHFHGDDRFYYWNRYLKNFGQADRTLFFSASIAASLDLGEKAALVPGGGVRAVEHGDLRALARFREVNPNEKPFFLVLGRKTASKGYERAIAAQKLLQKQGFPIGLVLIGPDEDGRKVEGEGLHYLGQQPREVVRGALQACLGLVSMSTSESFGIVLCEAWLFGKPVIANRACYSFRELVRPEENGLLVGSDAELAAAMRRIATERQVGARMGLRGFAEVQERFTWGAVSASVAGELTR